VCVSICVCLCACVCMCVCLYVCVCMCVCVCVCVYVCVSLSMCVYVCVSLYVCVCVCECLCLSVCVCMCQCVCFDSKPFSYPTSPAHRCGIWRLFKNTSGLNKNVLHQNKTRIGKVRNERDPSLYPTNSAARCNWLPPSAQWSSHYR